MNYKVSKTFRRPKKRKEKESMGFSPLPSLGFFFNVLTYNAFNSSKANLDTEQDML